MIKTLGRMEYRKIFIYHMFDAGAHWFEVEGFNSLFFDTLDDAKKYVDYIMTS